MFEQEASIRSLMNTMNLTKPFAFIAAGLLVASSAAFAGDKACCAHGASNDMKAACSATFAKLDLTAEQRTMEKGARGVLTKEQFATWKAACSGKMAEKAQS